MFQESPSKFSSGSSSGDEEVNADVKKIKTQQYYNYRLNMLGMATTKNADHHAPYKQ